MKLPRVPQRTTTAFAFSLIDRCIKNCLGARTFGKPQIQEALAFFFGNADPTCVFCGSTDVKRWDHLVPITKGGETVLGNMVPACARCDDSKQHLVFDEWMLSDAKHAPKNRGVKDVQSRIERIREYMSRFGYKARPLEDRLNDSERARLAEIQLRADSLRRDLESLIDCHARRHKVKMLSDTTKKVRGKACP